MRGDLWPAGTISGGCAVRYSGLRSSGYEQGSNEGYEKNDSGAHAGIVVAISPGSGNDSVAIRPANQDCSRLQLNGTRVISNCLISALTTSFVCNTSPQDDLRSLCILFETCYNVATLLL